MSTSSRRVVDWGVVGFSTLLLQIHSIQFWRVWTGEWVGWAWSIALEACALWLWHRDRTAWAVLASALLIAGPFHHISAPAWESMHQDTAHQALLEITRDEVAQLTASLANYDGYGWAGFSGRTQSSLDDARNRLRELTAETVTTATDWRSYVVPALQALTLLVVMVTQIQAVISLRNRTVKPITTVSKPDATDRNPPETGVTDYETTVTTVARQLETSKETQKTIAANAGVRAADVSMVRNHTKRVEAGQETISEPALRRLAEHLGGGQSGAVAV